MDNLLKTDVLIVGAGPTGLMAANLLMRFGIEFILIDHKSGPTIESRAISITSRSLELYQQLGLSDYILSEGAKINSFNIYVRGKYVTHVHIGEIGEGKSDFSFLFSFEQSRNEQLLYDQLKSQGRDVVWETEFRQLTENDIGVEVLASQNGNPVRIQAQYLVAGDGARSDIRHQLQIPFEGGTYENKFFVADTILHWPLADDQLLISPGDHNFCGFFPLKGKGAYRILGTLPDDQRENDQITFADLEKTIRETTGIELTFEKVNWFSIYKLHHRCVDSFSKGHVFLAGDSAHIHSPAGGQGMNTGLQDAANLAWKLAFVLKKWAKPAILQTYNEERLPFARWLMRFTDQAFRVMTSDHWAIVWFRRYVLLTVASLILQIKWIRMLSFKTLSQTGYSYRRYSLSHHDSTQPLKFRAGDRLPYIRENPGEKGFYSRFSKPGFYLIHISQYPASSDEAEAWINAVPFPLEYLHQPVSPGWQVLGVRHPLFILLRPDHYILLVSDHLTPGDLGEKLGSYFVIS